MLTIPETGMRRSVTTDNVKLYVLSDWIEGSVLFDDDAISKTDVVDYLCEENVYADQPLAMQGVDNAWSELQRREKLIAGCGFHVDGRILRRTSAWQEHPAHAFCIAMALVGYYERWRMHVGGDYVQQGDLFEDLALEALTAIGWETFRTGWASGISMDKFSEVVDNVANRLQESFVNKDVVDLYKQANEEGLDLVCYKPFPDRRGGKPVFLVQCASGQDWKQKLKTPDLDVWNKLIAFSAGPQRAFVTPLTFEEDAFFQICNRVNGMVFDRYRILSASRIKADWLSATLTTRLVTWLEPRLNAALASNGKAA